MEHTALAHPLLNDEHQVLRARIRQFAETQVKPLAADLDENAEFSVDLTKKMGKEGLLGLMVPQKYGGQGKDTLSYVLALEELARIDSSQAATMAAHNSLGLAPILNHGTKEQKEYFLPKLMSGEKLWAFGITEDSAGSDISGVKTRASLEGEYWEINGSKKYITNSASECAAGITLLVITGTTDDNKNELSAILLERPLEGYETKKITNKLMWRAVDTGEIHFTKCRVPKENLLGERGQGARIMLKTLDAGRLSIAAIGLGLAQGAYEMALEHAKKRKQFGKVIGSFQGVSFKLAEMEVKLELARNTLYKACWQKDNHMPFSKEAAISKLYCSEIAREIADETVQIYGARGLMKDWAVERFYRDQRILQIGEGTSEILKLLISRQIML